MIGYSPDMNIRAHLDVSNPYYNHSYDRYVRNAYCKCCDSLLGEQVRYPDFEQEFHFADRDFNKFKFCPYCGKEL